MDDFGNISSIESLPLPDGQHVKVFDAAQAAAKKAARAAINAAATGASPEPEVMAVLPIPAVPGQETAKQSEALDSNASAFQSLVPATLVSGEYINSIEPGKPVANSGRSRSVFRADVDHDSGLKPIRVPG
jgi:hypothetical protein